MTASGFYHCSVKPVGRTNGRSIVAAAAYRSGERLADERTGETADYRARGGVVDTFILIRDDVPAWAHDRARLWNEAERAEPRANGRLATEFELALPHELTDTQRKQLLKDYLAPLIDKHGIAADVAIHMPGKGKDHRNIHAHVLLTHRALGAEGFEDIANRRTTTKKVKGQEKQIEIAGIAATPADIKTIRKDWEQHVNRAYERAGLDIRVDHRSHKDRGIKQEPAKHLGAAAAEIEKRDPGASDRVKINRDIAQRNAARILAAMREAEASQIKAEIIDLKAELAMQAAREEARGRYERLRETERQVSRDQFPGRYDELRAAEPPPEIVRAFASNAGRTAEPAAPIHDRDAENAAWEAKLAEAAINAQKGHRQPGDAAGRETRGAAAEQGRPASWIERRIADCAEVAMTEGATIQQDREGRRVDQAAAFADRLRPEGERETQDMTVQGPEAFAVLLEKAGIAIARVSEHDARVLDSLREEQTKDRILAEATGEIYRGNRLDTLLAGDLAAVTQNGDVYRINPAKIGEAPRYLADELPGVIETRTRFETERENTAAFWAEFRAQNAEDRLAREGERTLHRHVNAAERGVEDTLDTADSAVDAGLHAADKAANWFIKTLSNILSIFGAGEAKRTPQENKLAERAAEEKAEAQAWRAYDQAKETETDARIYEQQRTRDIARTQGIETSGDPEEERFRSIMQRSARDRERDRDYERER